MRRRRICMVHERYEARDGCNENEIVMKLEKDSFIRPKTVSAKSPVDVLISNCCVLISLDGSLFIHLNRIS